ncbi:hypothetical protein NUW54_g11606 [Trametes sanguinea]|uniref:Uncharacterized protein n=1 Tax=Trametes sanguinea TaxID=158606 RepID=A0ACC1NB00_9APHY|nr:hypothetical protein NUW54_g11606 [Trametes sanguinea]
MNSAALLIYETAMSMWATIKDEMTDNEKPASRSQCKGILEDHGRSELFGISTLSEIGREQCQSTCYERRELLLPNLEVESAHVAAYVSPLQSLVYLTLQKSPMPPPRWASDEQSLWLVRRRSDWRQARKSGQTASFIANTHNAWSQLWSDRTRLFGDKDTLSEEEERELGKAVKARQTAFAPQQLRTWYQNHGSQHSDGPGNEPSVVLPKVKGTRALQQIEVYSKQYYHSKIKPVVEEEIRRVKHQNGIQKLSPQERLDIVRRCTRECWEAEDPAIRQEIADMHLEDKARMQELTEACKSSSTGPTEDRTAEQYQHAIDNAPAMIERALAPIRAMTGGVITVLWSGPVPEDGGAIGSFAVHQGQNPSGHNFAQSTPSFSQSIVLPHVQFARTVFPPEVRQRRVLQTATESRNSSPKPSCDRASKVPQKASLLHAESHTSARTATTTSAVVLDVEPARSSPSAASRAPSPNVDIQDPPQSSSPVPSPVPSRASSPAAPDVLVPGTR